MISRKEIGKRVVGKRLDQTFTLVMVVLSLFFFAGCMKPAANAQQEEAISADLPPAACNEPAADNAPSETEQATAKCDSDAPAPAAKPVPPEPASTSMTVASVHEQDVVSPKRFKNIRQPVTYSMDEASIFNAQVHDIAVQLIENLNADSGLQGQVGVSTFVDLNYLYRTSPLGRYLAEQLMGELQRAGFQVVEIRKTDALLIKQKYGEYSLSREISEISNHTSANIILVGTYMVKGNYVFINARLVSTDDGMVASSAMKIMPNDTFMRKMLWPSGAPEINHKSVTIPIKSFGDPTEVRIIQGS